VITSSWLQILSQHLSVDIAWSSLSLTITFRLHTPDKWE
jgi:hypothetical protein